MLNICLKPTYFTWDLAVIKQWTTLHLHKNLHKIPFPSILWTYFQRISKCGPKVCFCLKNPNLFHSANGKLMVWIPGIPLWILNGFSIGWFMNHGLKISSSAEVCLKKSKAWTEQRVYTHEYFSQPNGTKPGDRPVKGVWQVGWLFLGMNCLVSCFPTRISWDGKKKTHQRGEVMEKGKECLSA